MRLSGSRGLVRSAPATILLASVATVSLLVPQLSTLLIDVRARGHDVWRPLTGHLVHATHYHLLFNLMLFVPLGVVRERRVGCRRYSIELCALAIAVAAGIRILHVESSWATYCGLSGVVYGLITLSLLTRATPEVDAGRENPHPETHAQLLSPRLGAILCAGLALKSALEYVHSGWLVSAAALDSAFGVEYLAGSHCAGIGAAIVLATLERREARCCLRFS